MLDSLYPKYYLDMPPNGGDYGGGEDPGEDTSEGGGSEYATPQDVTDLDPTISPIPPPPPGLVKFSATPPIGGNNATTTVDLRPCKDVLWINMLPGTPSNLQKVDYCNRCASQPGTNGNPTLGNFPVNIVGGFWYHLQTGTNYCPCCSAQNQLEPAPRTNSINDVRGNFDPLHENGDKREYVIRGDVGSKFTLVVSSSDGCDLFNESLAITEHVGYVVTITFPKVYEYTTYTFTLTPVPGTILTAFESLDVSGNVGVVTSASY